MFTKSRIQQINEAINLMGNFSSSLQNLMEKYTIEDSIFVYANNSLMEATKGYFVTTEDKEYNTLNEAIKNCNIQSQGIRVINNERFQVGDVVRHFSECDKEKTIMDIESYVNY